MSFSSLKYISQKNRLVLYNLLLDLLNDGVLLYEAMLMINSDEGRRVYGSRFIDKLSQLIDKMKTSSSITEVLTDFVPHEELLILNASERSGQLINGLSIIISLIEKNQKIKNLLFRALITPVILFVVILLLITGYSQHVFPTFESVMPVIQWPNITQNLYGFGNYLAGGGLIQLFIFIVGMTFLMSASMSRLSGSFRVNVLDKFPPYTYYRMFQLGFFLRMLAALMLSGIPLADAVNLLKKHSTPWMNKHLCQISDNMKAGKNYKESLDTGLLTDELLLTIKVYSGLDSFTETVGKMAGKLELRIVADIKKLSKHLKSAALIGLSLAIAWVFVAIFSLVDKLGSALQF